MNAGGSRKRTRRKIERNVPLMTKLEAESPQTLAMSGRNKGGKIFWKYLLRHIVTKIYVSLLPQVVGRFFTEDNHFRKYFGLDCTTRFMFHFLAVKDYTGF